MTTRVLALVRHGESQGNLDNRFTGCLDLPLTPQGEAQARLAGGRLQSLGIDFIHLHTSTLARAVLSGKLLRESLAIGEDQIYVATELRERDYGQLTGMNKMEAQRRWGSDKVQLWRRSYAETPPGGESLRDTVARVVVYYLGRILPGILRGEPTVVVAHGNSLRALVMAIEQLSALQIESLEISTGEIILYQFAADATVGEKHTFS